MDIDFDRVNGTVRHTDCVRILTLCIPFRFDSSPEEFRRLAKDSSVHFDRFRLYVVNYQADDDVIETGPVSIACDEIGVSSLQGASNDLGWRVGLWKRHYCSSADG